MMCVETSVSGCTSQRFTFTEGNVLTSARVNETLGKTKVYHVYRILTVTNTQDEVIWLYVAVDELAGVESL